jgi:hypothetical protein
MWILAAIVVGVILLVSIPVASSYLHKRDVTVVVNDKERVCSSGNGGCKYLVYTDHGTFKITDSLVIGRFTSSDAYGQIKRCHKYILRVYGWRVGLFSSYPNIVKATDEGRSAGCSTN